MGVHVTQELDLIRVEGWLEETLSWLGNGEGKTSLFSPSPAPSQLLPSWEAEADELGGEGEVHAGQRPHLHRRDLV